jgi:hypothetical protein
VIHDLFYACYNIAPNYYVDQKFIILEPVIFLNPAYCAKNRLFCLNAHADGKCNAGSSNENTQN